MKTELLNEDELAIMAIYRSKTKDEMVQALREAADTLEESNMNDSEEEMLAIIIDLVEKLSKLEDKYYYSLELENYLYDEEESYDD